MTKCTRGLRQRVEYWSKCLHVLTPHVHIRDMTHKWGSCSTLGIITLATDLGNQDIGFQDFVIVHELLHLRVPNHGKLFKALLNIYVPNWKQYDISRHTFRSNLSNHTSNAPTLSGKPFRPTPKNKLRNTQP